MFAVRSVRALTAVPAPTSAPGPPGPPGAVRGKATPAAQPLPRFDGQLGQLAADGVRVAPGAAGAPRGDQHAAQHQELLNQLQEHEIRIPVPWGHIAGKWWGRRDRRPLVALHGWGDNACSFERLAGCLRGVPVLALDLPGHGLSSPAGPAGPADRALLLAALRRVQRALGLTSLSLVGHSLGDNIALLYTATYPTDVDLYVSLDPLVPVPVDADGEVKMTGALLDELLDAEDAAPNHSPQEGSNSHQLASLLTSRRGSLNRHAAETLLRRGARCSDAGRCSVLSPEVALAASRAVRCPTLCVLPEWRPPRVLSPDPELRAHLLANLRMAAKTLTAVTVAGTHHVHLNNPEVVMPALNDFLDLHRQPQDSDERVAEVAARLTV